jgi:hypothetical protein
MRTLKSRNLFSDHGVARGLRSPVPAEREEFRLQRRWVRHLFDVSFVAALTPLVLAFLGTVPGLPASFRLQIGVRRAVRMPQTRYIFTSESNTSSDVMDAI